MSKLNLQALASKAGVIYSTGFDAKELTNEVKATIAMDQATMVTAPNAGIPALFTTYVDPKVIEAVVSPMKMAEVFGEVKKGDWTDTLLTFPMIENVGEVSTYGDFNGNATADANVNFPSRQPYHYQTNIRLGEREMAMMGRAKIDWASKKQISAALVLNKFQNRSYLFGIDGLENYGMLNDPSLSTPIAQADWSTLDANGVYEAIVELYSQRLVPQTNGVIDRSTSMKLIMSPKLDVNLTKTNEYKVNVSDLLAKNFPNIKVEIIPEYSTDAGEVVQLIVESYDGQETVDLAFTEKMRVHEMVRFTSGWEQKRSQGTCGAIIYRPMFVAQALVG